MFWTEDIPHINAADDECITDEGMKLRGRTESAGKSRRRVKGESPYIVKASDQL